MLALVFLAVSSRILTGLGIIGSSRVLRNTGWVLPDIGQYPIKLCNEILRRTASLGIMALGLC